MVSWHERLQWSLLTLRKKKCMLYITTVYYKFGTLLLTLEPNSFFRSHELMT